MKVRDARAQLIIAAALIALGSFALLWSRSAPTVDAQAAPALLGSIPGPDGRGILVTDRESTVLELIAALRAGGCEPAALAHWPDASGSSTSWVRQP